jgi:putative membrane protein
MTTDAWLALAHHAGAFTFLAVLAAEWAVVRPGITTEGARLVARIDAGYGLAALTVIAAGIARVIAGAKPASFYMENPVFWLKMAALAAVGVLSIRPTMTFVPWRQATDEPDAGGVLRARKFVRSQLVLFPAIPACAALMARGIGL